MWFTTHLYRYIVYICMWYNTYLYINSIYFGDTQHIWCIYRWLFVIGEHICAWKSLSKVSSLAYICVCVCIPWQRFSQVSASACILGKGTIFNSMVFQRVLLRIFFRFEFLFSEPQLYSLIYSHSKKKKFNGTVKSTFKNLRLLYSERWYCYQPEPTKFSTISALVQRRKLVFTSKKNFTNQNLPNSQQSVP
jgi:hypothetical protein